MKGGDDKDRGGAFATLCHVDALDLVNRRPRGCLSCPLLAYCPYKPWDLNGASLVQVLDGEPWYDSPPKGKASTKTARDSADKNREYREKRRQQQQSSGGGSSGGGSKEDPAKEEVCPWEFLSPFVFGRADLRCFGGPLPAIHVFGHEMACVYAPRCVRRGRLTRLCVQENARLRAAKEAEAQLASDDDVVVSDIDEDDDDGFI